MGQASADIDGISSNFKSFYTCIINDKVIERGRERDRIGKKRKSELSSHSFQLLVHLKSFKQLYLLNHNPIWADFMQIMTNRN